jgi:hypothetical protein
MLVGQQLERGLAQLRALPGAVAAEVVDEMRAAALQRGLAPGFEPLEGAGGNFAAQQQGALLLGDGAGRAWQVRRAAGSKPAAGSVSKRCTGLA